MAADDERVIITEHKDGSGRSYSVTRAARDELYPGFYTRGVETEDDFLVTGVPKPKRVRKRPRAKEAAPVAAPVAVAEPADAELGFDGTVGEG